MTWMPGAPKLPPAFWDSVKLSASESARLYPYLTLFTLCTFALIFITIPFWFTSYVLIRKEQLRYGYLEKKDKADTALKKLGLKIAGKTRQPTKQRKRK